MSKAKIYYFSLTDEMLKEEKLLWFKNNPLKNIPFERITPSKKNNWINLANNDFEELLPLADKDVKLGRSKEAVFELFFSGVPTNRDEWVYGHDFKTVKSKMSFFSEKYNLSVEKNEKDETIKWSRDLEKLLNRKIKSKFDEKLIIKGVYRPYFSQFHYTEKVLNDVLTQNHYDVFGKKLNKENIVISFSSIGMDKPFHALAISQLPHLQITPNGKNISLYRYDSDGTRHDNLTDWGLGQFQSHYQDDSITKESIFHYTYSVLHHPAYRSKYALNLKREFPRLPFYADFWQWSSWGKTLMDLHLNYATVQAISIASSKQAPKVAATPTVQATSVAMSSPKPKLKADKAANTITLDTHTTLTGIPALAWEYKLGNRSALEWILDQYKEKKPRDATIAEHFNTYRFADYKEEVIDLLCRVCTVSVKTMEIINQMPNSTGDFNRPVTPTGD